MAVACARFDNGNGSVLYNGLYQPCAASWDKQVDIVVSSHHFHSKLSVGVAHKLDDIGVQSCTAHSLSHKLNKYHIGVYRFLAASENTAVSAFKAQDSSVHGNVGTSLVDHADNAHRHTHFSYAHTVRSYRA